MAQLLIWDTDYEPLCKLAVPVHCDTQKKILDYFMPFSVLVTNKDIFLSPSNYLFLLTLKAVYPDCTIIALDYQPTCPLFLSISRDDIDDYVSQRRIYPFIPFDKKARTRILYQEIKHYAGFSDTL